MRLYICADGSYAGTQADAGKGFTQVEVPTDKAGLLVYLNAVAARDPVESPVNGPPAAETPSRPPMRPAAPLEGYRVTETGAVVDFIMDRATQGQVETIFSALGSRFAEFRR